MSATVCEDTGTRASNQGVCPVHGGDACLIVLPQFTRRAREDRAAVLLAARWLETDVAICEDHWKQGGVVASLGALRDRMRKAAR